MPVKDLRGPSSRPSGDPCGAGEVLSPWIPHFPFIKPPLPGAPLQRAIAPQLPRRDDKRRSGPTVNVETVYDLTRDVPESLDSFQSSNSLCFADFIQKFELVVVCGSASTPALLLNSKEAPRHRFRL